MASRQISAMYIRERCLIAEFSQAPWPLPLNGNCSVRPVSTPTRGRFLRESRTPASFALAILTRDLFLSMHRQSPQLGYSLYPTPRELSPLPQRQDRREPRPTGQQAEHS